MRVKNAKRSAATESVAALRARLERRFAATPAMLHSIDREGRLVAVSDAWLSALGYRREDVLGRPSLDFLAPESREHAVRDVVPRFYRDGRVEDVEYRMIGRDGRAIDVLISAILEDGDTPDSELSIAVVTDITARKTAERRLAESEARYRGLIEDQSEYVSLAMPSGELRFVNRAYAELHGKRPEELVGRSLFDFIPGERHAAVAEHLLSVGRVDHGVEVENEVRLANGQTRWIAWTNRALTDAAGVRLIHSVGRDIQWRVETEQRLKDSEAQYRLLADNSTDMVFQLDMDLVRRYVSPASKEILGYEPSELIGVKPIEKCHPDDAEGVALAFQALLSGERERQTIVNRRQHRDGRWIWVEAQLRALRDPKSGALCGMIGALRDISLRKYIEEQLADAHRRLEVLAAQDGLTGLPNRRTFDEALSRESLRAVREKNSLALIMLDVDCFKLFNDRYGHPAGDRCLLEVGRAIANTIRRPADLAARYGGEEFAVLLPNTDEAGAAQVAERLRSAVLALALPHEASAERCVTISLGVSAALKSPRGEGAEILLRDADTALYRAKAMGRNRVVRASGVDEAPQQKAPAAA